ncbi:DsrE family protein [Halobellus rufus]|uniref:DsrE family protein n=1 Tax=Halobellus rufus TaxID=1448860 RepID=UPI000678DBB9|nr:DsrE family protein [Halobellus rufus]
MFILITAGPDDPGAALPFVAAKGAMENGEAVSIAAMADAVSLLRRDVDLRTLEASGLPTVAAAIEALRERDALADAVALRPCCEARDVAAADLREWASVGEPSAISRLAAKHETTLTF